LSDWTVCRIDLPKNYRRTVHGASRRWARRWIAASPDLNTRRDGVEGWSIVWFITIRSPGGFAPLAKFASFN